MYAAWFVFLYICVGLAAVSSNEAFQDAESMALDLNTTLHLLTRSPQPPPPRPRPRLNYVCPSGVWSHFDEVMPEIEDAKKHLAAGTSVPPMNGGEAFPNIFINRPERIRWDNCRDDRSRVYLYEWPLTRPSFHAYASTGRTRAVFGYYLCRKMDGTPGSEWRTCGVMQHPHESNLFQKCDQRIAGE